MKCKNPNAPISPKQQGFIASLQAERNLPVTDESSLTMGEASDLISALMDMPKAPAPSLTALAAAIEQPAAPVIAEDEDPYEHAQPVMLAFDKTECQFLKGALSVAICETDGSEMDHVLVAKIDAFLNGTEQPTSVELPHYIGGGTVTLPTTTGTVTVPATAKPGTDVPAGHYALKAADGTFDFYKVDHGKEGTKWDGFVFLSKQAGDEFIPVKPAHGKAAILNQIATSPLEAAKAYGHELGVCGICHKTLTDPESIANGIGPVCASKF